MVGEAVSAEAAPATAGTSSVSGRRRLAAIMVVDVAGFSLLIGRDETRTLACLKTLRHELIDPKIRENGGRIVNTTGDGLLVEFGSVVDAVRSAVELQRGMSQRDADVPSDRRIAFRIGIHMGDIVVDGDDILGDGVNVAARLEALAEPGSRVQEEIAGKLDLNLRDGGERALKNIARPVRIWRWSPAG
jgi:adenylate cyclase